ncbi:MAG: hypothetical protein JW808_00305 [Victivallales bacterium]|nr:hypothetical protein [Victivallales bacterium]
MIRKLAIFVVFFVAATGFLLGGNAVWWEGESAKSNDFVKSAWLDEEIRKTRLSGMDWLTCFVEADAEGKKEFYSAEYEVVIPADSEYTFWVREFYRAMASPWEFRFDDGEWIKVGPEHKHFEGSIDDLGRARSVVWCEYGKFKFTEGRHNLQIRVREKDAGGFQAGFDAFLLTDVTFVPDGWKKPQVLAQYGYIGTYLWLEGEDAEANFVNKDRFPVESESLSKGKWLVCSAGPSGAPSGGYVAKWSFVSPLAASYNMWIRESLKRDQSPVLYRINDGQWKRADASMASVDHVEIADGAVACWVNYKMNFVQEGENTLEIKVDGENRDGEIRYAVDAIVFTIDSFVPQGKLRPDSVVEAPDGWFVFRPGIESAEGDAVSVFDLRKFNPARSDAHGFCSVDAQGLVFEDGTRPRFWGVNLYNGLDMDNESMVAFVRRMARYGVNLIRVSGSLGPSDKKSFGPLDDNLIDRLCYLVAACRHSGIYVALALYDPADYLIGHDEGYEGYTLNGANHPYGLLYVDQKYRDAYKQWSRFLGKTNPYTKMRLFSDPTIVWFEVQSGKGVLDDELQLMPQKQKDRLEQVYNDWLVRRHGDLGNALKSWSTPRKYHPVVEEDGKSGARRFRLLHFDSYRHQVITSSEHDHLNKRKGDQLRFIMEISSSVHRELIGYIRDTCRFRGVISVGNGFTSSPFVLGAMDALLKSSGDFFAYREMVLPFRPENVNDIVTQGTLLRGRSVLTNPLASPFIYPSYAGKPTVLSEVCWPFPNEYRGESVPFMAAYASLLGHNPLIWQKCESLTWVSRLSTYNIQTPGTAGQFPGYALMFRRGDVRAAGNVALQQFSIEDILQIKGIDLYHSRARGERLGRLDVPKGQLDPLSFFVGKVECKIVEKGRSFVVENIKLEDFINSRRRTISSSTRELNLNYNRGVMTINTPKAQALIGSTDAGHFEKLADVTISKRNSFGNVLVISLDDRPLSQSGHVLVQSFARELNNGWQEESVLKEDYKRLVSVGDAPIILEEISGNVTFHGIDSSGWEAWQLDSAGVRIAPLDLTGSKTLSIDLPRNAIFTELKKK